MARTRIARRGSGARKQKQESAAAEREPLHNELAGALDQWVFHLAFERRLASRSVAAYRTDLLTHLCFLQEHGLHDLREVTPDLVRESVAHLHDRGLAPRSRLRARSAIRSFYRWLVRDRRIPIDPAAELEAPRSRRELPRILAPEEVVRLLDACSGTTPLDLRDRALIETAYGAGLRVSELIGLTGEEVNLREQWLRVRGKGSKERMVPLGRPATSALRSWFHEARPLLLGRRRDPGMVFLNARGGPLSRMGFWKILRRRAELAGLGGAGVHPHLLRHSFATHLLHGGASLLVVQELLGHRDLTTTEIYTAIDRDFLRKVHREFHPRG